MDRSGTFLRAFVGAMLLSSLSGAPLPTPRAAQAMPARVDPSAAERVVAESTGAAVLRIPIAVPPGPGGTAPALALSYSSRAGDGPFGVGWSLDLPEIRCSARFGVPNFARCEHYELGDALLVRDPAAPNEFHTAVESFQRIRALSDGSGSWWTAERPDGTKLTFGRSVSHRIRQAGYPVRWLLESREDAFGNQILFSYERAPAQEAYLASVRYGTPPSEREIDFIYEARPDARPSFAGGIERHLARRLREMRVVSGGGIYRRYAFGYDAGGATARSRLAWVQEFGADCTAADPVAGCAGQGLPPRTFRYRDASDVGAAQYSQSNDDSAYRIPFGDYTSASVPLWRNGFPILIGDLDGDGLPDRLEIVAGSINETGVARILINTGSGFEGTTSSGRFGDIARRYQASFESLTYDKPRWEYRQIHAPLAGQFYSDTSWNDSMYAMCSVTRNYTTAHLADELLARGAGARTSSLSQLLSSGGAPSQGYFEPLPSVKMADLDSDGLADLIVSTRLGGVTREFDCSHPSAPLSSPERFAAQTISVVFRNTGVGWQRDDALASGLPPFEEVIAKSTRQTELDEPSPAAFRSGDVAMNPCANRGVFGFEQYYASDPDPNAYKTAVCHSAIDLAPQFVDFDGDGYLDLAVLERDDSTSFWSGASYWTGRPPNTPRTHVWLQRPGAAQRWQRAPQYDLPAAARAATPIIPGLAHAGLQQLLGGPTGHDCVSWLGNFPSCAPNSYRFDNGVRLVDVNRDGLVDVVWSFEERGVLLNTGGGLPGIPSSAWCASRPDDVPLVGGACPDAAAYAPPGPLAGFLGSNVPVTTGLLADLNGDRFPDFVQEDLVPRPDKTFYSWIQGTGTSGSSGWRRDARFDFHLSCFNCRVPHPATGALLDLTQLFPRFEALDIDGDGSDDVVGDTDAFLSRSRHSDLVRAVDNGRGGALAIEYAPMSRQRDAALDAEADGVAWAGDAGPVALWRATAVVSRATASGPNLAPPGDITDYRYAHPRFDAPLRSDLGFGLVRSLRAGGTEVDSFFYQDPGRTGRTALRLVKDAGSVVHRYSASWEHVAGVIPGSIAGVHLARLVEEQSANEYEGYPGALQRRRYVYNDAYGYDFVAQIQSERASSSVTQVSLPRSADLERWIIGLVRERRDHDDRSSWASRTQFTYTAEGRLASELRHRDRGDGSAAAADLTQYAYDARGNLIRRIDANGHTTELGYDASGSVLTSRTDPAVGDGAPGAITRWTPHPVFAVPTAVDPGYRDEPRIEFVLDPFGRAVETWTIPRDRSGSGDGVRALSSAVNFEDRATPPYVERFQYTNAALDAVRTAVVDDGFGGVWKTIRDAGPGANGAPRFAGSATYRDPARRLTRTTYDLACANDDLCRGLTGAAETPAALTAYDALARPLRVDTPRGASLSRYAGAIEPIAQGAARSIAVVDVVWSQNAKGDLLRRSLDGDRTVAVEECANSEPHRADLRDVACARGSAPNRTLYTYHPSGGLEALYDPVGVDAGGIDPRHALFYRYDSAGQVIAIDDPDAGHSETFYDGVGNAVKTVNARSQVRLTTYDALGRRTRIQAPEGDVSFLYRSQDRQPRAEYGPDYAVQYTYDGFGQLSLESRMGLSVQQSAAYRYDLLGRRTAITVLGNTVQYEYAGAFLQRVCSASVTVAVTCSDPAATPILSGVSYDAIGRRSAVQMPGGLRSIAYANADTRDVREDRFVGASTLAFEYLARDPLGNVLAWAVEGPPGTNASGSYTFDARNRIASRTRTAPGLSDASESYAYDALGNLTAIGGQIQRFEHPAKPHALTSRGAISYAYDASGNLRRAGARYFRFDSANRLACAGSGPGQCDVLRVIYDAAGERIAERAGGTTRGFIGPDQVRTVAGGIDESRLEISALGERVAYTVIAAPQIAAPLHALEFEVPSWVLALPCAAALLWCLALAIRGGLLAGVARRPACAGLAGLLIAAVAIPSPAFAGGGGWTWQLSTRWVLSDALGSGLAVLDETGLLLHQTRFEPFGAVDDGEYHAASDPSLRRYFAGHPEQAETGLHYMNARWLDPQTGVFLSVDPLVASTGDPQSHNAYAYARNNPIALADPTGAFFESPLAELQNCDRCSGFSFVPGFYMAADGTGGWITSQSQFHQVEGEFTEARAAAGWVDRARGRLTRARLPTRRALRPRRSVRQPCSARSATSRAPRAARSRAWRRSWRGTLRSQWSASSATCSVSRPGWSWRSRASC